MDFVGPISPPGKCTGARYIITATDYLTRWAEETPVKYCTATTMAHFLFENVITRFGCPKILISEQGTHFINKLIVELFVEFQIQNKKTTPYHPQANGIIEAFNKVLKNALTKVCNMRYYGPIEQHAND